MQLKTLTLRLTGDCNFRCRYCYSTKSSCSLSYTSARKAIDIFYPCFTHNYHLIFYGGEPLLEFPLLKKIVFLAGEKDRSNGKKALFSITTNGSLLNDDILNFIQHHSFHVELSFDGLAQDIQRKKSSFKAMVTLLDKLIQSSRIDLEVNSVFTPETVGLLADSVAFMAGMQVPRIRLSLSSTTLWDDRSQEELKKELERLEDILTKHYKETGTIPVLNYIKKSSIGLFTCMAGQERMAVDCDGNIYGCDLFREYTKRVLDQAEIEKYCLGNLESLAENHHSVFNRTALHYSRFSQDKLRSGEEKCFLCPELKYCGVCPVNSFLSGGTLFDIPPFLCSLNLIRIQSKKRFWARIESLPA
ncbi:MAG: 4Fe-4S cluster-binding domain-containing protein [Candidatus Aminicenantes bacterium]|nr:4Fe-4S cluster-binding domain-containing protein [Candidatus Aminicenantes bacterium]